MFTKVAVGGNVDVGAGVSVGDGRLDTVGGDKVSVEYDVVRMKIATKQRAFSWFISLSTILQQNPKCCETGAV